MKKCITVDVNNSSEVIERKERSTCNPVEANNLLENNYLKFTSLK